MPLSNFSVGPWLPDSETTDFVRVTAFDQTLQPVLRMAIFIDRYWISDTLKPSNDTPKGRHLAVAKHVHGGISRLVNALYEDPTKWTRKLPLRVDEDYGTLKIA